MESRESLAIPWSFVVVHLYDEIAPPEINRSFEIGSKLPLRKGMWAGACIPQANGVSLFCGKKKSLPFQEK